ncbi:MAG: aminotransferase class I/II-fold pyridoxal phosphate-dependent enzyme, partial [Planctomycetaceae bacterium]
KSHSMTGLRLGFVHGPQCVIQQMLKLQQFTFVCAPHPVQYAGLVAWDYDVRDRVADYKRKRDFVVERLRSHYEIEGGQGAFYLFPKAPWGTGGEFVAEAIANQLLIIPGNVFSPRDTHFRISYAALETTLERGCDVLIKLAKKR